MKRIEALGWDETDRFAREWRRAEEDVEAAETAWESTEAIDRITISCASAMRGKAEVTWNKGMPPLVNDTPIVDGIRAAAQKLLPADAIKTIADPSLGSEDFSYLFPAYGPGAQFSLGCGNDSDPNTRHGLHNSKNVFDEGCLAVGTAVLVQYARDFLG